MRAPSCHAVIAAPFARLGIRMRAGKLAGIEFLSHRHALKTAVDAPTRRAVRAIERYLADPHAACRLSFAAQGTDYQQRVWRAICAIPPGQVRSYGELARRLGSGPRAVASACRANPIPLLIPCHRVVATHGLGGYCRKRTGPMLAIKRWLLAHEGLVA